MAEIVPISKRETAAANDHDIIFMSVHGVQENLDKENVNERSQFEKKKDLFINV